MPRKVYERPCHTANTSWDVLNQFPSWMAMSKYDDSVGFQFVNTAIGQTLEQIDYKTKDITNSRLQNLMNGHLAEIYRAGRIDIPVNTDIDAVKHPIASGHVGATAYPIYTVDNQDELETAQPTRATLVGTINLANYVPGTIQGITWAKDMGVVLPTSLAASSYIEGMLLNCFHGNTTRTYFFDAIASSVLYDETYGINIIDYTHQGKDEILQPEPTDEAGFQYKANLEHLPIIGSVKIIDVLNLQATGDGVEVPSNEFEVRNQTVYFRDYTGNGQRPSYNPATYPSGIIQYPAGTFQPDTGWSSQYIAEYQSTVFASGNQMDCYAHNIYSTPLFAGKPLMVSLPPSSEADYTIPFWYANDPAKGSGYDNVLAVDPVHVRHGRNVLVTLETTGEIDTTLTLGSTYIVPSDFTFYTRGIHFYNTDGSEITERLTTPNSSGWCHLTVSGQFIETTPVSGLAYGNEVIYDYTWPYGVGDSGFGVYTVGEKITRPFDQYASEDDRYLYWPVEYIPYVQYQPTNIYPGDISMKIYYGYKKQWNILTQSALDICPSEYKLTVRGVQEDGKPFREYALAIPSTVIPILGSSTSESTTIQRAAKHQWTVEADTTDSGVAYCQDTKKVWMLNRSNISLVEYTGSEGKAFNLFRNAHEIRNAINQEGTTLLDKNGNPVQIPYEMQVYPSGSAIGLAYYKDFLYFLYNKDLYRLNVFDRRKDCVDDWAHIDIASYLTNPTDITFNEQGQLLVADGTDIKVFDLNKDYGWVDTTNRMFYTLEIYDAVYSDDLGLVAEVPETYMVWNHFDEIGLVLGTPRLPGENNRDYRERLRDVFKHMGNSSVQGLINGLSRDLGLERYDL